jgi:dipeptidyl aminopeptidase/acylaminoacyl peptidase
MRSSKIVRSLVALISTSVLIVWTSHASAAPQAFNPRNLFNPPGILLIRVSPSGEWIAATALRNGRSGVIVQYNGQAKTVPVYQTELSIRAITWIGDRTLIVEHSNGSALHGPPVVIRLSIDGATVSYDQLTITAFGSLVDGLPDDDEVVLWGLNGIKGGLVKRGPVTGLSSNAPWKCAGANTGGGKLEVVARINQPVIGVLADRNGVVRIAAVSKGRRRPKVVVLYRASEDASWRDIWRAEEDEDRFEPVGFTQDGERLIIKTRADGDTVGLYEYDPDLRAVIRPIFVLPGVDITDVVFDYNRDIIAVEYLEGGQTKHHYFDDYSARHLPDYSGNLVGDAVSIVSTDRDRRYFALFEYGATNPGIFYFYDRETRKKSILGELRPGIPSEKLIEMTTINATSKDGTTVEAYLARPDLEGGRLPPLFVMPHGGPVSVRDSREFDPFLQYIALEGIAVLKVNFRGSSGFGKEFEDAGKQQWSGAIEDDIDAAVQEVLNRGLVDTERVCIGGGSYGGYSALVSVVRHPDLYDCAATINGVTDIPLLLSSSDFSRYKTSREDAKEIIGDIEEDYDHLVAISPVYQAEGITVPVLIIQGSKDVRVPPDSAYRLRAMLEIHDKPYDWLELPNAGHSFNRVEWLAVAAKLRRFLNQHLKGE